MNYILGLFTLLLCIVTGCSRHLSDPVPADWVFVGDNIITMDPSNASATGVAVRGDTIVAVGSREDVLRLAGEKTQIRELGNRALVPGFIDSHGHAAFSARLIEFVNLSSPPVGTATNIDDIVALLKNHIAVTDLAEGQWVVGYGYDDSLLTENRHPDRDDLDRASANISIYLLHVSGHLAAVNSAALRETGINEGAVDPKGGVIRRRSGSTEPNGVLEEKAASAMLYARLGTLSTEKFERMLREVALQYASYGVTTVQDGFATPDDIEVFRFAAKTEPFPVDIVAYRGAQSLQGAERHHFRHDTEYDGGFRVAGVKFSVDGSPQGRTAWLTEPYSEGPPGADPNYVAYPTVIPDVFKADLAQFIHAGTPVLVHGNGDAAIDLAIEGISNAVDHNNLPDHRSVIIHAQLMREDQLDQSAELGIVPSFFSAHTFFWGDWHLKSFGLDRAKNISPTRWALDKGVKFTLHNDAPVVPPNMMRLLWATVTRRTRSGQVIGPHQRISVYDALYAMTLGGAYQLFEEQRKGSITVGKQADLVLLEENPQLADPARLKDIAILETIARGQSVFSAGQ